jgi:hypothetical protein
MSSRRRYCRYGPWARGKIIKGQWGLVGAHWRAQKVITRPKEVVRVGVEEIVRRMRWNLERKRGVGEIWQVAQTEF